MSAQVHAVLVQVATSFQLAMTKPIWSCLTLKCVVRKRDTLLIDRVYVWYKITLALQACRWTATYNMDKNLYIYGYRHRVTK